MAALALVAALSFRGNSNVTGQNTAVPANRADDSSTTNEQELILDTRGAIATVLIRSNDLPAPETTFQRPPQVPAPTHN